MNLSEWHHRYDRAAIATIPITRGAKAPPVIGTGWADVAPAKQWQSAGREFRGNIAVLCGHGLVLIDADAPETEQHVSAWAAGRGLDAPIVRTRSGGTHRYVLCKDVPAEMNWRNLALGPGELRCRRAYTMAPPSLVDGRRYSWVHGSPEQVPTVRWKDLATLVASTASAAPLAAPPVPLVRREMPAKAEALLYFLRLRPAHAPCPESKSRSDLEASVVTRLILSGWHLAEIRQAFEQWQPGHYWQCGNRRMAYLDHTYASVLGWIAAQGQRGRIAVAYHAVEDMAWPGRTGLHDRAVLLALLAVAWQCGSSRFYASQRDLAQASAKSRKGVANALHRLCKAGLVQRQGEHSKGGATIWYVNVSKLAKTHRAVPIASEGPTTTWVEAQAGDAQAFLHELWGWYGLGQAPGAVYHHLRTDPLSAVELVATTGKSRATVHRALRKLESHGLAQYTPEGWRTGSTTLQEIAEEMHAQEHHRQRCQRIEDERAAWARHQQGRTV